MLGHVVQYDEFVQQRRVDVFRFRGVFAEMMLRVTQFAGLVTCTWIGTLTQGVSYGYSLFTTVGIMLPLFVRCA